MWLVSSRGLGCDGLAKQVDKLQFWHYDRERSWVKTGLGELLASDDPQVTTVVFLHGNRISHEEAFTKGWNAYRVAVRQASERPVRFVIWSWPSEAVRGPVNDARVKAARTNPAGYFLAWLLDQLNPDVPVCLWGHSFGAHVATGALHLLGGGAIGGHKFDERVHPARSRCRRSCWPRRSTTTGFVRGTATAGRCRNWRACCWSTTAATRC